MIPLRLSLSGFLSYRDLVEIDFTNLELACISGSNGAGKSSLLDAITWALFGQARKRDESLINQQSNAAEVMLEFEYEGNLYRVQRTLPRGKTSVLEFHIREQASGASSAWRPLTERTQRETQERIQQTLRLDYDTFVNASFFLQGKADQFTQQRPGDRKRILGNILGLEVWETYRQRAWERRKRVEGEIDQIDGRTAEINAELAEESSRRSRLAELQSGLATVAQARKAQEKALESMRRAAATLAEQRRLVETLDRQAERSRVGVAELRARWLSRQEEHQASAAALERAEQVEAAYAAWQEQRIQAARMDEAAVVFREQEQRRQGPLTEIETARARLVQEQETLQQQEAILQSQQPEAEALQAQVEVAQEALAAAEEALARRAALDEALQAVRQRQADARAENPRLKAEMDALKARIDQLRGVEGEVDAGGACPLCGQPLSVEERARLVESLTTEGLQLGDRYRANQALWRTLDGEIAALEGQIGLLAGQEQERLRRTQELAGLQARLDQISQAWKDWQAGGAPRLAEIARILAGEDYAGEARQALAKIDEELKATGYDPAAHEAVRRAELEGRAVEAEFHALEKARARLAPLEREIGELAEQLAAQEAEHARQQQEYEAAAEALAQAEQEAPDLDAAEREFLDLQEQENSLRMQVGAARQKVDVLEDLKTRRETYQKQREELARQAGRYKALERAFGKDGVPALLIEQALPEIERRANDLLDRLSGGTMTVRFVTQEAYKDKRREDLKETLDIQISDSAGTRDYEMFSGGEAFRVNFAVRLALSEVLAQRAGARLQTLVIDEGFGSQDAQGRQRLIEAINLVRGDFAKVLVITHIDELKDAFPARIEVEKTARGSTVRVV
ncbi:MAG: SMC family ATPase [Anaerolineales bacterium]|nr:SMC family ATPase [Anaerolineales bacterium]